MKTYFGRQIGFLKVTEYLSYDLGDVQGDLGGYLGLCLGWSLLSMTLNIPIIVRKIWSTIIIAKKQQRSCAQKFPSIKHPI